MQIADCCAVETDASGKELVNHGSPQFPLAIYHDHLEKLPVDWHWHEELELIYQIEGEGLFAINDHKLVLQAGEGLFINAEALHGCWDTESHLSDICSLVFHPRLVGGSQESVFWQKYMEPLIHSPSFSYYHFHKEELGWARSILEIWTTCQEEKDGYEFTIRNKLSELMHLLCQKQKHLQKAPSARMVRNNDRIKLMLNYIHTHYATPIRVLDIAQSAMISESECLRCFREMISTSPGQYLKHYRIAKACEGLKNTEETVSQIGERCGFSDESYFVKQFREEIGLTPGGYRKLHQS